MAQRTEKEPGRDTQNTAGSQAGAGAAESVRAPLRIRVAFDWDAFVVFLRVLWRIRIVPGLKVGLLVVPALLFGVGLQAAVPPLREFGEAVFCFPAVVVVFCLLVHGAGWGLAMGLLAGVVQDTLAGTPLGISSLAYVLAVVLVLGAMRWPRFRSRGGILVSAGLTTLVSIAVPYLAVSVRGDGDLTPGRLVAVSVCSALLAGCLLAPLGLYAGLAVERVVGLRVREAGHA